MPLLPEKGTRLDVNVYPSALYRVPPVPLWLLIYLIGELHQPRQGLGFAHETSDGGCIVPKKSGVVQLYSK